MLKPGQLLADLELIAVIDPHTSQMRLPCPVPYSESKAMFA